MKNTKLFLILIPFVMLFSACKFNTISREAEYKVSHYLQNAEDDGYTLSETETLKGLTGSQSEAAAKEYEGFTALNFSQKPVSEGIEIEIKYDRKIITCALDYNGGTVTKEGVETKSSVVSGRYGTKIVLPEPVKEGYSIENWTTSDGTVLGDTFLVSGTYSANYVKKADGQFKVTYSFQNLEDDDYSADTNYPDEVFPGMKGETTNVIPKAVKGFVPETVEQKEIAADGSTVIEVKYARKLVTLYISLNNAVGKNYIQGKACKDNEKEKSHAQVVAALNELKASEDAPKRVGNDFECFVYNDDLNFSIENDGSKAISVKWGGGIISTYTVKVYKEKLTYQNNDKYELVDSVLLKGMSGNQSGLLETKSDDSITIIDEKKTTNKWSFFGFEPVNVLDKEILGNETTVIELFYDKKTINLKFELQDGPEAGKYSSQEYNWRYGDDCPLALPEIRGYQYVYTWADTNESFDYKASETIYPNKSGTVNADWHNGVYKIIFHNTDGTTQTADNGDTYTFGQNFTFGNSVNNITNVYSKYYDQNGFNTLAGWCRTSNCDKVDYEANKTYVMDEAEVLDLYAIWNVIYRVCVKSYSTNTASGGTTTIKSVDYLVPCVKDFKTYYDAEIIPEGYVFDNETNVGVSPNRDSYYWLRSKWSVDVNCIRKDVVVTFRVPEDAYSAELPENNSFSGYFGQELSITPATKNGYKLVFEPEFDSSFPAKDTTFIGNWGPVDYTITYQNIENVSTSDIVSSYNIESATITLPEIRKDDMKFDGWYLESDFKNKVTEIPAGSTGNKTFYAKWIVEYKPDFISSRIESIGDVILNDGTVWNIGKYYKYTIIVPDEIKNKAVAVITHQCIRYDTEKNTWRGIGINRSGVLSWAGDATTNSYYQSMLGYISDGLQGTPRLLEVKSNAKENSSYYPAWNYVWTYGTTYCTDVSDFNGIDLKDDWYMPAWNELNWKSAIEFNSIMALLGKRILTTDMSDRIDEKTPEYLCSSTADSKVPCAWTISTYNAYKFYKSSSYSHTDHLNFVYAFHDFGPVN